MLLDIITIVLHETLEAGVLISILLSIANKERYRSYWLLTVLFVGVIGSVVYAVSLRSISQWFDGVGQEVVNAVLQLSIFVVVLALVVVLKLSRDFHLPYRWKLYVLLMLPATLAMIREGAEIIVFYSGYLQVPDASVSKTLTSGFVGLSIGLCVGALVYYLLALVPERISSRMQTIFLMLVAAGMVLQATQLLIQADWLTPSQPLWNTQGWLSESSTLGQLLYAVFGYEASPTNMEVYFYLGAWALFLLAPLLMKKFYRPAIRETSRAD